MYRAADHAATGIAATDTPSAYLTRFHYDTILHDGAALRFLAGCVGVGQLVLGTDLPFPPGDPDPMRTLRIAGFSEADIERVVEATPRQLFHIDL
jgi:aminocarboxymuconate-semialdehyde decarboxylase